MFWSSLERTLKAGFTVHTIRLRAGSVFFSFFVLVSYNLVNGKNPTQGRLQITYNGVPGSVCGGDSFKEPEARVVCKSMGYRYVQELTDSN